MKNKKSEKLLRKKIFSTEKLKRKKEYDLKKLKKRPKRDVDHDALKIPTNLRLDAIVLADIKEKADLIGLPYQSLINSILKQYLNGELIHRETLNIFKDLIIENKKGNEVA